MSWLDKYYNSINKETSKTEHYVYTYLLGYEKEIKQLIKDRWKQGKRPNGDIIGGYRSPEYAIFKHQINPTADGMVDLILTGDLINRIKLIFENKVELISTDEKFYKIANKYGYDNFNITETQEDRILSEIATDIINEMMKKIWN